MKTWRGKMWALTTGERFVLSEVDGTPFIIGKKRIARIALTGNETIEEVLVTITPVRKRATRTRRA